VVERTVHAHDRFYQASSRRNRPYSQAVRAGHFIFVRGQSPLDPATQQIIAGDVGQQTERVLNNIAGILEA